MKSLLSRFWRPRLVRVLVWIAGSLLTLYLLFCAWVNYSGAKRWAAAQAMLQLEGESLDFRKVVFDAAPEARNFCAIPALKEFALAVDRDVEKGEPAVRRKRFVDAGLPDGKGEMVSQRPLQNQGATFGKATDLAAWAAWLRKEGSLSVPPDSGDATRDVLAALSKNDALIAELAAGLGRDEAQWTPEWKTRELPETLFEILLPHYEAARQLVQMLTLRAAAAARTGDAAKAFESLLIALRLARASLNDPMLISTLVACAQTAQVCGAVWELCDAHAGSADDFKRLELELARLDFRAGLLRAFRGELAAGTSAVFWLKKSRDARMIFDITDLNGVESSTLWPQALLVKGIPGGWFDMNAATMAELEFEHLIKPLRDEGLRAGSRDEEAFETSLKKRKGDTQLDSIMACLLLPSVLKVRARVVYTQCLANEAIAACALERHRIEHNSYPDMLDAVKRADGKSLPPDVFTGRPMGYRKTDDGKYALWCVGFDGKDDDGKRGLDAKKAENTKFYRANYTGDWVWDFPVK